MRSVRKVTKGLVLVIAFVALPLGLQGAPLASAGLSNIGAVVDPSFTFSVQPLNSGTCNNTPITGTSSTSTAISLGRVEKTTRAVGGQILSVASNAGGGFSVNARMTGPLADGRGRSLSALDASASDPTYFPAPGTEAFGFTTSSQLQGGNPARFYQNGAKWAHMGTSDQQVMYNPGTTLLVHACVAYQVTISPRTIEGNYASNVIYTAVPTF